MGLKESAAFLCKLYSTLKRGIDLPLFCVRSSCGLGLGLVFSTVTDFLDGYNFSYGILLLERSVYCCASRHTEFFFSLARKFVQTEM
jgi:hypothetical protein